MPFEPYLMKPRTRSHQLIKCQCLYAKPNQLKQLAIALNYLHNLKMQLKKDLTSYCHKKIFETKPKKKPRSKLVSSCSQTEQLKISVANDCEQTESKSSKFQRQVLDQLQVMDRKLMRIESFGESPTANKNLQQKLMKLKRRIRARLLN